MFCLREELLKNIKMVLDSLHSNIGMWDSCKKMTKRKKLNESFPMCKREGSIITYKKHI